MEQLLQNLGQFIDYVAVVFAIVFTGIVKRFWLWDKATADWTHRQGDFASLVLPVLPIFLAVGYAVLQSVVWGHSSWQEALSRGIVSGAIAGQTWKIGRSAIDSIFLSRVSGAGDS